MNLSENGEEKRKIKGVTIEVLERE